MFTQLAPWATSNLAEGSAGLYNNMLVVVAQLGLLMWVPHGVHQFWAKASRGGGSTFLYPKSVFQVALSLCIVMLAQLGWLKCFTFTCKYIICRARRILVSSKLHVPVVDLSHKYLRKESRWIFCRNRSQIDLSHWCERPFKLTSRVKIILKL